MYTLKDISTTRTWAYEHPTLVKSGRLSAGHQGWADSSRFLEKFTELYPFFEHVSLDDIAISGGCVVDILLGKTPANDIDLYYVATGTKTLEDRIKEFLTQIYGAIEQGWKKLTAEDCEVYNVRAGNARIEKVKDSLLVTKFKGVYTIKLSAKGTLPRGTAILLERVAGKVPVIQISQCESLEEHMKSVDIACTAIAFFNDELYFSSDAKFAMESGTFVVDDTNNSMIYNERVIKYFNKGFDIILPGLDFEKLPKKNLAFGVDEICDLPHLTIQYRDAAKNKIHVTKMFLANTTEHKPHLKYDFGSDLTLGTIIHHNVQQLVHGRFDKFICVGEGSTYEDVFKATPNITPRMLANVYETIIGRCLDVELNLDLVEEYFPIVSASKIVDEFYISYIQDQWARKGPIFKSPEFKTHIKEKLDDLRDRQIRAACERLERLSNREGLQVAQKRKIPRVNPQEWYGKYARMN